MLQRSRPRRVRVAMPNAKPLVPPPVPRDRRALKVVVAAILVGVSFTFLTWASLSRAGPDCSSGVCWGGDYNNFLNFVRSDTGWVVDFVDLVGVSLIAGLIFRAIAK